VKGNEEKDEEEHGMFWSF